MSRLPQYTYAPRQIFRQPTDRPLATYGPASCWIRQGAELVSICKISHSWPRHVPHKVFSRAKRTWPFWLCQPDRYARRSDVISNDCDGGDACRYATRFTRTCSNRLSCQITVLGRVRALSSPPCRSPPDRPHGSAIGAGLIEYPSNRPSTFRRPGTSTADSDGPMVPKTPAPG